jgi:hypothetical protein
VPKPWDTSSYTLKIQARNFADFSRVVEALEGAALSDRSQTITPEASKHSSRQDDANDGHGKSSIYGVWNDPDACVEQCTAPLQPAADWIMLCRPCSNLKSFF